MVEQKVQRVESVLKQIRELKEDDEKAAKATGKNFNVFSLPGFGYNELDHSAFLANLLNPKGTHSQGAVFLRHFLKQLDSFDYENPEDFKVAREAYVGVYGQIDILLEKEDACVIIENKIKNDPKDQDRQLERYYKYAKKERGLQDEQIKLIYLTPYDGIEPREISLSREDRQRYLDIKLLILMSYKSHILKWLEDCLKEVAKIAPIREVLFQYQVLVKGLSGQPINKELTMKISDILIENYDLISELESSISEAKKSMQDKFWKELKKKITKICGLEVRDDMENGRTFKVSRCKSLPSFEIALMVELELYKGVWYGFVLLENGSQVGKCKEKQFKRYVNLVHNALETRDTNEWTLGWKYLKDRNEANLFSDFGAEQMRYIAKDDELKKTVDTFAQEIKDAVDEFIKAKEDDGL